MSVWPVKKLSDWHEIFSMPSGRFVWARNYITCLDMCPYWPTILVARVGKFEFPILIIQTQKQHSALRIYKTIPTQLSSLLYNAWLWSIRCSSDRNLDWRKFRHWAPRTIGLETAVIVFQHPSSSYCDTTKPNHTNIYKLFRDECDGDNNDEIELWRADDRDSRGMGM